MRVGARRLDRMIVSVFCTASLFRCSGLCLMSAMRACRHLRTEVDPDVINAGKQTITELDRTSYISSADSFAMIRGGHIDLSVLGAMEVSEDGDLTNWMVPGRMVKGPGGAIDLVSGVARIIVLMDHSSKDGTAKFRKRCTLPLTGANVVDLLITDFAVFERPDRKSPFHLIDIAPGITLEDLRAATEADFLAGPWLRLAWKKPLPNAAAKRYRSNLV